MPTTRRGVSRIAAFFLLLPGTQGCTTLLLGKKATADGSVIATHSNDGEGTTDPRLVRIPAADWPAGATRPVWPNPESYPRYVGKARLAEAYYPEAYHPPQPESAVLGEIPQVNHTYAYWEETYGALNEKQLGIGESTCSAVYSATSVEVGGGALFSVDELSKIAMERTASAREAVQLMGDLAVAHGFHGQSGALEGGGESLMVVDPNEGFVFHVLADKTGTSAM
jgi:dipeptidase